MDARVSPIQPFYMNHLLDFTGKKCNLRLAVLNDFGGCAKKNYAR